MSKENNLTDFLTDVADAIREKKGTTDLINPQDFSSEIKSLSKSMWTGHVDVEGLKAIGWDDEDIAYYQEHGVNWMEEDDEYHKVSEDNKALYGVVNADNIQEYKDRIVYLPKIDTSAKTNMISMFKNCTNLISLPKIDTDKVTSMENAFNGCSKLACVPILDTSKVKSFYQVFYLCKELFYIPQLNTGLVNSFHGAFATCTSLRFVPIFNYSSATSFNYMFNQSTSIEYIRYIDSKSVKTTSILNNNPSLIYAGIDNINFNLDLSYSYRLSKESLLFIINNESASGSITITLFANVYARYAEDTDVIQTLAEHPLVSLASA